MQYQRKKKKCNVKFNFNSCDLLKEQTETFLPTLTEHHSSSLGALKWLLLLMVHDVQHTTKDIQKRDHKSSPCAQLGSNDIERKLSVTTNGGMFGLTDRQKDSRTDERTDGRTNDIFTIQHLRLRDPDKTALLLKVNSLLIYNI